MRKIALMQRSPALSFQEAGRMRLQIDRHFAIDRLAGNRSQNRKSYELTQFAQVAGFPQRNVEEAIGARSRYERHLTT
jgi:hypothetical protein